MPKMIPKIILEGTRLTHKTDIAFALNIHPRIVGQRKYQYHSPLISGEWGAFNSEPWGRGLINFLPEEEDHAMETYRTWMRLFELQRYYSWIIDRFHFSTILYQQMTYGTHYDFGWLEKRLDALNFHVVLCTRQPQTFEAARVERLKVSGNPSQYDDLSLLIKEQEQLQKIAKQSILPVLQLDISDDDVEAAVNRIADWMEETGGLYAKQAAEDIV